MAESVTGILGVQEQSVCTLEEQIQPMDAAEPAEEKERLRKRQLDGKFTLTGRWKKVLSWNLNGARARVKDGSFMDMIREYDVLCLTEFRCPWRAFLRKKDKMVYSCRIYWNNRDSGFGQKL